MHCHSFSVSLICKVTTVMLQVSLSRWNNKAFETICLCFNFLFYFIWFRHFWKSFSIFTQHNLFGFLLLIRQPYGVQKSPKDYQANLKFPLCSPSQLTHLSCHLDWVETACKRWIFSGSAAGVLNQGADRSLSILCFHGRAGFLCQIWGVRPEAYLPHRNAWNGELSISDIMVRDIKWWVIENDVLNSCIWLMTETKLSPFSMYNHPCKETNINFCKGRMIMVEKQDIHSAILAIMESMRLQGTSPGRLKNFQNAYNVFERYL